MRTIIDIRLVSHLEASEYPFYCIRRCNAYCGLHTLRDHMKPAWNEELYGGVPLFTRGRAATEHHGWNVEGPRRKV